ncbi:MAG: RpiB/LacA/LacB family sugar-phosphate isomerase [bacterium]|nr:RpiB/LacA/LacB family sugar-phosphate isomerase [bacterium]
MKIYLGSDHAGFEYKKIIKEYLPSLGLDYEVVDKGAFVLNEDDDYPDFVTLVALDVAGDKDSMGIVFGGSGQGEAMCANTVSGVRATVFYGPKELIKSIDVDGAESNDLFEIIKLAREHNDANILSIGARFVSIDEAKFAIELFLKTKFSGEERHIRRLTKFNT